MRRLWLAAVLALACSAPRPSTVGPLPRPRGGRVGDYCTDASLRWRCQFQLICDVGICKVAMAPSPPPVVDAGVEPPDGADAE